MRPIRAGSLTAVDRAEELKQTKEEHPLADPLVCHDLSC